MKKKSFYFLSTQQKQKRKELALRNNEIGKRFSEGESLLSLCDNFDMASDTVLEIIRYYIKQRNDAIKDMRKKKNNAVPKFKENLLQLGIDIDALLKKED